MVKFDANKFKLANMSALQNKQTNITQKVHSHVNQNEMEQLFLTLEVTNIKFLCAITIHNQEKNLRELIK